MVSVEMIRKLRRHVVGCMFLKDYLLSLVVLALLLVGSQVHSSYGIVN